MIIPAFHKTYSSRTVLDFPEYELKDGLLHAVIGANGCGKSTLAKLLAGVIKDDRGNCGIPGLKIGYLPQKAYAFRMSVRKNILMGSGDAKRAETLLDALALRDLADKKGHTLSGGETARMCLARLLMRDYDLLILDEPTAAMDMQSILLTEQILSETAEKGSTILLITHSVQQASRIADEVLFLKEGQLAEHGPAPQLLHDPKKPETAAFLDFFAKVE